MYNITLISTRHHNNGECNAHALCQILEHIKPEVIFEEMRPSFFDKYYIEKTRTNLEVQAISAYLIYHNVQHIPVDIDEIPSEAFFRDYQRTVEQVLGLNDDIGFNYRSLVATSKSHAANYGFNYLNSHHYNTYIEELRRRTDLGLNLTTGVKMKCCKTFIISAETAVTRMPYFSLVPVTENRSPTKLSIGKVQTS